MQGGGGGVASPNENLGGLLPTHLCYYLSNIFSNMHGFKNWGISLGYSPVLAEEYSVTSHV